MTIKHAYNIKSDYLQGNLNDGQDIAVKRLSKNSKQGPDEFKNEVMHIVKLQHRNLVKLLGCCIEGDETMLVYEFMPNRSLDFFIFGMCLKTLTNLANVFRLILLTRKLQILLSLADALTEATAKAKFW